MQVRLIRLQNFKTNLA